MNMSRVKYLLFAGFFILIGTILSPILFHSFPSNQNQEKLEVLRADPNKDISSGKKQALGLEDAFQEVFESVSPSVVSIATERTIKVKSHPFHFDPFDPFNGGGSREESLKNTKKSREDWAQESFSMKKATS